MHVSIYIQNIKVGRTSLFFLERMAISGNKVGIAFAVLIVRFRGPKIFATFDEDISEPKIMVKN